MTRKPGFLDDHDAGSGQQTTGAIPRKTPDDPVDDLPRGPVLLDAQPDAPTRLNTGWEPEEIVVPGTKASTATYVAAGVGLLLASWAGLSVASFVLAEFQYSSVLGTIATLLTAGSVGLIGYAALSEWRAYRSLRSVETLRAVLMANDLPAEVMRASAQAWLARIAGKFVGSLAIERALQAATTGPEIRAVVRGRMADKLRGSALQIGRQAAMQGAALVAICPHSAWDGVIAGLRGLQVIRQVAALYGVRPGLAVTLGLVRRVAWTAVGTEALVLMSQSLADMTLEKLPVVKHIAGALPGTSAAGIRLYRLARITAEACCPVSD